MGDDDLGLPVDGRLRVIALDIAVLGEQHAAVGIREVALRLGLGLAARRSGPPAVLLSALRLALVLDLGPMPRLFGGGSFGVRFQRRLGGADRLDPLLLVVTQSGISSPRASPCSLSSSASAASAALSQWSTSACSSASRAFMRS